MCLENDEMAYSVKSQQKLQHWFLFPGRYFCPQHTIQLTLIYEHRVKEENTGLYSFPLKLKPACLPSMALCVQVCWCLNEFEGTWRQDWALSLRALQGISQKGEFIGVWVEQETLPSAVLRRSGCMHACRLWAAACLAPDCVFLSTDLCCCRCCEEVVLPCSYKVIHLQNSKKCARVKHVKIAGGVLLITSAFHMKIWYIFPKTGAVLYLVVLKDVANKSLFFGRLI